MIVMTRRAWRIIIPGPRIFSPNMFASENETMDIRELMLSGCKDRCNWDVKYISVEMLIDSKLKWKAKKWNWLEKNGLLISRLTYQVLWLIEVVFRGPFRGLNLIAGSRCNSKVC
jgi:hypothetical protein